LNRDSIQFSESHLEYIFKIVIFASLYVITAKLGLLLPTISNKITPIWPPTGLAFALLFLGGKRFWPAVAIGAFIAAYMSGNSLGTVIPITVGNTLEALCASWIYKRTKDNDEFGIHSRTFALIASAMIASLISANIGVSSFCATGIAPWNKYSEIFLTWWSGDAMGAMIVFPFALNFFSKKTEAPPFSHLLLIVLAGAILSYPILLNKQGMNFLFLFFPYLYLCTYFAGEKGVSVSIITILIFAYLSLHTGKGAFHIGQTSAHIVNLQLFLFSLSLTGLFLLDFKAVGLLRTPAIVLLAMWTLSGFVFAAFNTQQVHMTDTEYTNAVEKVEANLKAKMERNLTALQSGAGLIAGSDEIRHDEWNAFFNHLNLAETLNGLYGLGKITIVNKKTIENFLILKKKEGRKAFSIHSIDSNPLDYYYIVEFIEPFEQNKGAIGMDIASEKNRREAAELARDTGAPTITRPIKLIQKLNHEDGFLLYYPIYSKGPEPITLQERRARIEGWIYAPVLMKDYFASVFQSKDFKQLTYSISTLNDDKYLTASHDFSNANKDLLKERTVNIFNQTYKLTIGKSQEFLSVESTLPSWVAACAAIVALGLGSFVVNTQLVGVRAKELAKKMTLKLKMSEEKMRIIFESSHDTLFLASRKKDGKLYYVSINAAHEKLSGIPNKNFLNLPLEAFTPSDFFPKLTDYYASALKSGEPVQWEQLMHFPSGKKHTIVTINLVKDFNSTVELYVGTIHDITERKAAEELLKDQQMKLTLSAKMSSLGEMAGGIAHEINNPLTIINSKAVLLRKHLDNGNPDFEKIKNDLVKIEDTSNRIAKIIRGLNSFSRNTEGDPMEDFSIGQIIEDTLELCGERFKYHSIALTVDIQTDPLIHCRPLQITQVIMNLLCNAYDAVYERQERWVKVQVTEDDTKVTISVTDSGKGISNEVVEKMMNPFFTTKDIGKGTGLGLSISKGIVEDHTGLFFYDIHSPNTRFIIELPKAQIQVYAKAA